MDIPSVPCIVFFISDAMVFESALPDSHLHLQFLCGPVGEAAFDELRRAFHGNPDSRCDHQVQMVGHENKLVQEKPALLAVAV